MLGKTLVFGASGYIGSNLVPTLLAAGVSVRAASRRLSVLSARGWENTELIECDGLNETSLAPALQGIDTAYYLVHSMAAGRDFGRLDCIAADNFAKAAAKAKVKRIVYLGGLIPENANGEHILSRRDTGNILRQGSVPVIELRAGIIVGPGSAAFEVMRDLVFHLPIMVTPKWVHAKSPPIALSNLLYYLLRLPEYSQAENQIYDAGGSEVLSYAQMMQILAETAGKRSPLILPTPFLSPRLSSYWLKFVTAVPTNVARALIDGLKHNFTADTKAIQALIPQPLLTFKHSVMAVFEAERKGTIEARWVEGAFNVRNTHKDTSFYAKSASGSTTTSASKASIWKVVTAIGGDNRYYYLNGLWTLREIIDWLVGGHGLKHKRRHPQHVRLGDKIDSWEVIGVEHEQRLTLRFGMRAPGAGVLEFELIPRADNTTELKATAYWHPAGVLGLAYWYSLEPAHKLIFDGLTREICRLAEP